MLQTSNFFSFSFRFYFAVYKTFTNVLYSNQKTNTNKNKVYIKIFTVVKCRQLVEDHVGLSPSDFKNELFRFLNVIIVFYKLFET